MGDVVGNVAIRLEMFEDFSPLQEQWRALQERADCTFYQTFEWCQSWQSTIGVVRGYKSRVIAGFTKDGELVFVLPFGIQKRLGAKVLKWLGTGEMTYGMGVFCPDYLALRDHRISALWPEILKTAGSPDLINLVRQPKFWANRDNPLAFLFSTRSANQSYTMDLTASFDDLYEKKRSSSTRRGNRKRDNKLFAAGNVEFGLPTTQEDTHILLEKMQIQQAARLAKRGITGLDAPEIKAFLFALNAYSKTNSSAYLLPFNLKIDKHVVAVMLGASFKNSYWALVASLTSSADLQRMSPGNYALRKTINALCDDGYALFDFSAGDSDYKKHWSDREVHLYESIRVATIKGAPAGLAKLMTAIIKRLLKNNQSAFNVLSKIRASIFGSKLS